VVFEKLSEKHQGTLYQLFSVQEVVKYLDMPDVSNRNKFDLLFQTYIDAIENGTGFFYMKEDDKRNGAFVGIHHINKVHHFAFVTIAKHPEASFSMHDFFSAVIAQIFDKYPIHRLEAQVHCENMKAQLFFEKCNFKKEGVMRENFRVGNKQYDSILFSLLKSDIDA